MAASDSPSLSPSASLSISPSASRSPSASLSPSASASPSASLFLVEGIDQENTSGSIGVGFGDVGNGRDYLIQGFTAGMDNITAVAFQINGKGSGNQGLRIWIDNVDANSNPTGAVGVGIGGVTEINNAQITTGALTKYKLAQHVDLVVGQMYGICIAPWNTSTHAFSSNYQDVASSITNPYASGRRVHGNTAYTVFTSIDDGNNDMRFRTYGLVESSASASASPSPSASASPSLAPSAGGMQGIQNMLNLQSLK